MKKGWKSLYDRCGNVLTGNTRFFIVAALVISATAIAYSVAIKYATAGPGQPFGGKIYRVTPCCTGVAVYFNDLTISPPISLPLLYSPSTIVYPYGRQTNVGSWILGTWTAGGVCMTGKFCATPIPVAGTMYMVGSSM